MAVFKKILAVFLSVIMLSLSFANSIFMAQSISRVYASDVVIEYAGEVAWEVIVAALAELGITGVVASNKEKFIEVYAYRAEKEAEMSKDFFEGIGNGAMNIYDSVTGAVRSVPWDEYIESLKGYHDSAVDSLTGIYAQYCPALIGYAREFAYGVATGAIVIDGFNDNVYLNPEYIKKQWSGEPFDYVCDIRYSFDAYDSNGKLYSHNDYVMKLHSSLSFPVAAYYNLDVNEFSQSSYIIEFLRISDNAAQKLQDTQISVETSTVSVNGAAPKRYPYASRSRYSFDVADNYKNYSFAYGANCPVFASRIDAENYLRGMGDVTGAINWDGLIDNNDLPFWGLAEALAEIIARAPDIGIGSYGEGTTVNDWADDLPFIGLDDLQDYIDKLTDVVDKIREGLLDGTYDLPADIPDITEPYTDAWDDVKDGSIPADDPVVKNPTKPVPGTKPGDIDIDDSDGYPIEIPDDIALDDVLKVPGFVPDLAVDLSDLVETFKKKFPFSIPWDLYYLLSILSSTPKTPVYYLPLVIERWGVDEVIVVDMSDFEEISILSRAMLSLLFAFGLMKLTVSVVSVIKEN